MQDSDGNKVGYIRMCRVLGQGTDKYGRELLQAITLKLEDNTKHGLWHRTNTKQKWVWI